MHQDRTRIRVKGKYKWIHKYLYYRKNVKQMENGNGKTVVCEPQCYLGVITKMEEWSVWNTPTWTVSRC
jgi:hypothetical protein